MLDYIHDVHGNVYFNPGRLTFLYYTYKEVVCWLVVQTPECIPRVNRFRLLKHFVKVWEKLWLNIEKVKIKLHVDFFVMFNRDYNLSPAFTKLFELPKHKR